MANNTSAKKLELEERLAREIALRREGKSYSEIAAAVGVTKPTVYRDVRREIKRLAAQNDAVTAEWREIELAKLDEYEKAAREVLAARHVTVSNGRVVEMPDPDTGEVKPLLDDAPVLRAVATLLHIAERRARLLDLDPATKLDVTGSTESVVRIITLAE